MSETQNLHKDRRQSVTKWWFFMYKYQQKTTMTETEAGNRNNPNSHVILILHHSVQVLNNKSLESVVSW